MAKKKLSGHLDAAIARRKSSGKKSWFDRLGEVDRKEIQELVDNFFAGRSIA